MLRVGRRQGASIHRLPRRVVLGNRASGILHSRKPSLHTPAYLYGTGAYTYAYIQVFRVVVSAHLVTPLDIPCRSRGARLLSDERGVPALSGHKQSTNWTGRLHIASKVPLCRERRMYICAARLRTIVPNGAPQARSVCRSGLPGAMGTSTMSRPRRGLFPVVVRLP